MRLRRKTRPKSARTAARSPKAGSPPEDRAVPPRVRRRQKTTHAAVKKDTMMLQAADGPRVLWGVTTPKIKKG